GSVERRGRRGGGQASRGAKGSDERLAPPRQAAVARARAADPDVEKILLGEVPTVAAQIRLDVELGGAHENAEPLHPVRGKPRLAFLGGDHLLALRDLAEGMRHRAAMAARSDDEGRLEATPLRHHRHAVRTLLHRSDAEAPAHVGAGGRRALEQVVIELAADDAVARRALPRRFVPPAPDPGDAGPERLDGERILPRIDLEVTEGLRSDPPRAPLDPREYGGVEHEPPQPGAGEPPRGRAAPGAAAHH